jgi:diguanylate cyclase (GGDEF)-like protein/PAS domain S-box-containing protein
MTLVQKAALTVTLFAVANFGFAFAIKHNWIDPAFEGFEQRLAEKSMMQVAEAIEYTAAHFDNRALDYASWDATYEYVLSGDPDYYKENLGPGVLTDLGIDLLVVIDKSGRVVSGPIRDIETRELIAIPEIPQGQWDLSHPLLLGDTRKETIAGIMVTQAGPMMVAAQDILTSLGEGESRGRVVVGRVMDDAFMRALGERVGFDIRIWVEADPEIPAAIHPPLAGEDQSTLVTIASPESNHLEAYRWLEDVGGNPSVVIRVDFSREMTQSASYIARLCFLWIVLQAGILVFIIMVPLHRAIIAPLGVLSRQLRIFRKTSDLNLSLDTESEGEVGEISREFGNMLSQLEEQTREREQGEEALRQSEQHLRAAQQVAQMGSWKLDLSDGSWWWSEELFRIYGRDVEAGPPIGEELRERIHPGDRERVFSALRGLIEGTAVTEGTQLRVSSSAEALRHYSVLWHVERGDDGKAVRVFGTASDVTEQRRAEEQLRRAAAVFDTATESIVIANPSGIILDVNSAFSETTGYSRAEVVGQSSEILSAARHGAGFIESIFAEVSQVGKWEGEIWIRQREGKPIPAWSSVGCTVGEQAAIEQIVLVFNDMTERKNSEEVIAHQANYDMLTKLPNRYLFRDRLRRALFRAKREKASVGLLFVDLDGFKKINDTLGHAAGDEALRHAAKRVNRTLRDAETAVRLGGDEFAVILPGIESALDVEGVAQRILAAVAEPLEIHNREIVLTASIGAAIYPSGSDNDEDLLRDADVAMHRSKKGGGNTFEFFTEEMNESAARRFLVESQLRKALDLGEFEVYYQPIVALPEARLVGVEALLRWKNAELGAVSPGEFIPIAERSGLIVPIGAWVLETACRQVKAWHDTEWPRLRIAVNLSPREVDRGDAIGSIKNALTQSGLPAEYLEIEVTERVFLDDVERVATIFREIKDLGVRLCIDDFGTGYSSLSYLQNYPFDVLKIDRAFVHGAIGHEDGVVLLQAINAMAESLRLEVVAEGVETREQMDLLIGLGCGFAQGFYFCRPMSAERLEMGDSIAALLGESSSHRSGAS